MVSENFTDSGQFFYAYQVFYKTLVGLTKMSFVFLYMELFAIPKFRVVCYAVNISIVLAIIAFDAATIWQCTPIKYFWNRTIKGGTCVATVPLWYGHAAWYVSCARVPRSQPPDILLDFTAHRRP